MKTTFKEENNQLVMAFFGRLDTAAAVQTEKEMQVLYNCDGRDIVLDCDKLEYISSSGLRLFLGLLKVAKPKGSRVICLRLSELISQNDEIPRRIQS